MAIAGLNGHRTPRQTIESECGTKQPFNGESLPKVTPASLMMLVESQAYRCALTGLALTPSTATTDHATPLSRGGEHAIANAQVVLDYVNKAKGAMTNEEFIVMCNHVAVMHPR